MNPQEAINNLENSFENVQSSIKALLRSLKEMSSNEVLNGSISEAQKILGKILPIDESSKKVDNVHREFLALLEDLDIKINSTPTQAPPTAEAPKETRKENTTDNKVSFDDVANQLEDLVEEEIPDKPAETEKLPIPDASTSKKEYRIQILKSLIYLGGSAKIEEIYSFIERDMKSKFKTVDLAEVDSEGNKNWNEAVKKERMNMVDEGLLSADSTNGTWEIVQKGIDYLSNQNKS